MKEEKKDVTFLWNLSKPFDVSFEYSFMNIHKDNLATTLILTYTIFGCNRVTGDPNLSCIDQGDRVGFILENISVKNASRYCIGLQYNISDSSYINNCNALLYVYGKFYNIYLVE